MTRAEATSSFKPLADYVAANPADFETREGISAHALWASWFWSPWIYHSVARGAVEFDDRLSASWSDFWWKGDGGQAGAFWDGYHSLWLPAELLKPDGRSRLSDALFAATRFWGVGLHFNKGMAGAPEEVVAAARGTAMNPDVASAFALAIIASHTANAPQAGLLDMSQSRERAERVGEAMAALRKAAPSSGSYLSESDYFQTDWKRAAWGDNYERLAQIKAQYDPDGLFFVHRGVSSDAWSADGFTRME